VNASANRASSRLRGSADAAARGRSLGAAGACLFALAALFLFGACTSGPPEILRLEWTLDSRPGEGGSGYESLTLFANVRDPDGIDDLEALWVLDDSSERYWSLGPSSWVKKNSGDDVWIGSSNLCLPDRSPLSRRPWRVVVSDLSGNRGSLDFRIEEETREMPALPRLALSEGAYTLESFWPENYLVAYDGAGAVLRSVTLQAKAGRLERALGTADSARAVTVAAYGCDPGAHRGAWSPRQKPR